MKHVACILFASLVACGSPPDAASPESNKPVVTTAAPSATPEVATPAAAAPPEDRIAPNKIAARHVLIQFIGAERSKDSCVRTKDQARAMAEEVDRRAKAGEDFARLAVEYSDEPNASQRGGSLGRFGKGVMAPQFEDAAFKLKVNQVSDVVETNFGFHVIQRTE